MCSGVGGVPREWSVLSLATSATLSYRQEAGAQRGHTVESGLEAGHLPGICQAPDMDLRGPGEERPVCDLAWQSWDTSVVRAPFLRNDVPVPSLPPPPGAGPD